MSTIRETRTMLGWKLRVTGDEKYYIRIKILLQVYNFHDESDEISFIKFEAGSDAAGVKWMELDSNLKLYASSNEFKISLPFYTVYNLYTVYIIDYNFKLLSSTPNF